MRYYAILAAMALLMYAACYSKKADDNARRLHSMPAADPTGWTRAHDAAVIEQYRQSLAIAGPGH